MLYSVWDPRARAFDYYESKEVQPTHTPAARHVPTSGLGATPDETAWPLPPAARKIGSGATARGRIATRGLGAFEGASPFKLLALAAVLFYVGKKVL
jgi:hypothetical protein